MINNPIHIDNDFSSDFFSGTGRKMLHPDCRDHHLISLCLSGSVSILSDNTLHEINAPYLLLLSPYTLNQVIPKSDILYTRYNIYFKTSLLSRVFLEHPKFMLSFQKNSVIIPLTEKYAESFLYFVRPLVEADSDFEKKALLTGILLKEISNISKTENNHIEKSKSYINEVLSFVFEHHDEKLTAEIIAKKMFISVSKLSKDFKTQTGITLNNYIIELRINKAKQMLEDGKNVLETAIDAGFVNQCHFIRTFHKKTGLTPFQYKKNNYPHLKGGVFVGAL